MTATNYMQRFVSEGVINECLEAYDTMNRCLDFLSSPEGRSEGRLQKQNQDMRDAAAYKFYNMEREVVTAIQHGNSIAGDNFQSSISDEHKLVLFRMMTRMIEDGSLQLDTSA